MSKAPVTFYILKSWSSKKKMKVKLLPTREELLLMDTFEIFHAGPWAVNSHTQNVYRLFFNGVDIICINKIDLKRNKNMKQWEPCKSFLLDLSIAPDEEF